MRFFSKSHNKICPFLQEIPFFSPHLKRLQKGYKINLCKSDSFNGLFLFDIYEKNSYNGNEREESNSMKPQIIHEKIKKVFAKHKFIKIANIAAIAAAAVVLTGALYFREVVYITDNGVTKEIKTNDSNVYTILKNESYNVQPEDKVTVTEDENNNRHITIDRAFEITVEVDGEKRTLKVTKGTVEDALKTAEITLGENDVISSPLDSELYEGMSLRITRINYLERTFERRMPFEIIYKDNSNLAIGTENILQEGVNGTCTVTYKDKYYDGELVSTQLTKQVVTKEPTAQIVERGTACAVPYAKMKNPEKLTLVNGIPENYVNIVSGKATAYSARDGALTASGRYAVVGTVAVNPNVIPYGSEVYVVSKDRKIVYGYAIAADTGVGMMEGTVAVDVFMGSYEDSCRWGACYVDIFVISEGDNRYINSKSERESIRDTLV